MEETIETQIDQIIDDAIEAVDPLIEELANTVVDTTMQIVNQFYEED